MNENSLTELLDYISGRGAAERVGIAAHGKGIGTHPTAADEKSIELHQSCLELERRGAIYRQLDTPDLIMWMPVEVAEEAQENPNAAIKKRAEFSTGPCTLRERDGKGSYQILAPDGGVILTSTSKDLATLRFMADSREIVLNLCTEIENKDAEILRINQQNQELANQVIELSKPVQIVEHTDDNTES